MSTTTDTDNVIAERRLGTAGLLPSLTGLRFVAAVLIFAFHATYQFPFRDPTLTRITTSVMTEAGPMAVDFFFMLSGFILTWTARAGLKDRAFWRRRFARIYPNHFVTWLLMLALVSAYGPKPTWMRVVPNLFLLHSWIPRGDVMFSMNFVSWSLSCEFLFYFAFPWLHRRIERIPARYLWPAAAGCLAIILILPLIAQLLPAEPTFYDQSVWRVWIVQNFPLSRALDFVIGILIAKIVRAGRWPRIGMIPATVVAIVAFSIGKFLPHFYGSASVGISLSLLIGSTAIADNNRRFTLFRNPIMVRLGEFGFAFYLVHWSVLNYGHIVLGRGRTWDTPTALALIALALIISCALTWMLHTFVEVPMERVLSGRRRPVQVGTGAAVIGPRMSTPAAETVEGNHLQCEQTPPSTPKSSSPEPAPQD
jgi:peptidoglycan/LPS O-acetylase OafA/YrhL